MLQSVFSKSAKWLHSYSKILKFNTGCAVSDFPLVTVKPECDAESALEWREKVLVFAEKCEQSLCYIMALAAFVP